MNIGQALVQSKINRVESEILLAAVLKTNRSFLLGFLEKELSSTQLHQFQNYAARRQKGEPLPYILGYKEFYGLNFLVNKDVLIPRPETEKIVEKVLNLLKEKNNPNLTLADIGTGSGCLAITLKLKEPKLNVVAGDISKKALAVAKKNAALHNLDNQIKFIESDLLEKINSGLDIIVANLPYIPFENYKNLPAEIKNFEPEAALNSFGSKDFFYKKLWDGAKAKLNKGGIIFYEIDGEIFAKLSL